MGKPSPIHTGLPCGKNVLLAEHIAAAGGTRGTETSKYPEEKKLRKITLVAASETVKAQTRPCVAREVPISNYQFPNNFKYLISNFQNNIFILKKF